MADDVVDLYRINQTTIEGRCPELLENLLEVRGIGLLDIRAIFGETAVRRRMRLKLIVHLVRRETMEREYERLPYEPLTQDILGVPVRKVVIQVVAGRNIAVLVEAPAPSATARHRHLPVVAGQRRAMSAAESLPCASKTCRAKLRARRCDWGSRCDCSGRTGSARDRRW